MTPLLSRSDALRARLAILSIAAPAPLVESAQSIQRKDSARNPRALQSVIESMEELECHSFDLVNNMDSLAIAD